jgi:hypothetical protein
MPYRVTGRGDAPVEEAAATRAAALAAAARLRAEGVGDLRVYDEGGREVGPSGWGCLAGALIGVAIVAAGSTAFALLTRRTVDLGEEGFVLAAQMLIAAGPFLLLGAAGVRTGPPWAVALALSLWLWGSYFWDGIAYQRHPDGTGANIGLGLLMLVSPIPIGAAALATHALERWARGR